MTVADHRGRPDAAMLECSVAVVDAIDDAEGQP
jgi:hypothetical protein